MKHVFEQTHIGNIAVKNRLVRSATWENLAAENGHMTEKLFNLHQELAQGGVGLIITGYAFVTGDEQPNPNMMGISNDTFIADYKKLTNMVHDQGSRIVMQVAYGGPQTGFIPENRVIWGPSNIADLAYGVVPTPMTRADIKSLIQAYGDAARRVKESGFDGVEIHAAHGYLLSQFLTPHYNRREDEYGGSIENRSRIIVEIYQEIRRQVGDYPIFLKLNGEDFIENGLSFDDCSWVAEKMAALGVDALDISGGSFASGDKNPCRQKVNSREKEAYHAEYAAKIANEVDVPVIVVGGIRSMEVIEWLLNNTRIEFFALSRPLLTEPDLPERWRGGDRSKTKCISCNGCFKPKPKGSYPCILRPYPLEDKLIRVNMTELTTKVESLPKRWAGLGGRAMTSTIVAEEVAPTCHPLGKNNKLVFAPGLLSGTTASNSGRMSCGSKSPLTGGIKESNAGGTGAQQFARLGIRALIIEGQAEGDDFYGLHISSDGVTLHKETELVGKGNFQVIESLRNRVGEKTGIISIGQAGEMGMTSANISVKDPDDKIRSHGRGGLGAVMGAKRLKFIAVDSAGSSPVRAVDPDGFKNASRRFTKAIVKHPVSGAGLPTYGTNILVNLLNEAGGLPTKNFRDGQFASSEKISGETMHDLIQKRGGRVRHGCHKGCVIQCSQMYNDKDGKYQTSGFEYETIWGLGAHGGVESLDQIAEADNIMDDIGVDSIETVVALGVAMEAGVLSYGDGDEVLRILREEVTKGTPLGRIIGCGTGSVGRTYGLTRVPVVKNQSLTAYDPRAVKGIGVTYATNPMGADHTAGYSVTANVLNIGGKIDPLQKEGQIELSRNLQIATVAIDSTGMCLFTSFAALDNPNCTPALVEMVNARFGIQLTEVEFSQLGKRILKRERAFNLAAGLTAADDRLPEFFQEPLPPHNTVWDFTDEELDKFWDF